MASVRDMELIPLMGNTELLDSNHMDVVDAACVEGNSLGLSESYLLLLNNNIQTKPIFTTLMIGVPPVSIFPRRLGSHA